MVPSGMPKPVPSIPPGNGMVRPPPAVQPSVRGAPNVRRDLKPKLEGSSVGSSENGSSSLGNDR